MSLCCFLHRAVYCVYVKGEGFFFFFQAEDGIRDIGVTGVQTCALPIFADLKRAVDPVVDRLDHYLLNEIEGLQNPTSELLAIWIWNQLAPKVPHLFRITIEETCSSRCHYYGGAL